MQSTGTLANASIASAQQRAEYSNNAMYRSMTQLGQSFAQMQAASKAQQAYNDRNEATLVGGEFNRFSTDTETSIQQEFPDQPDKWADIYKETMDRYSSSKFTPGDQKDSVSNGNVAHLAMSSAVSTVDSTYRRLREGGITARTVMQQAQANELANGVDAAMGAAGAKGDFNALVQGNISIAKAAEVRSLGMSQELQDKFLTDRRKSAAANWLNGFINNHPSEELNGLDEVLKNPLFRDEKGNSMFDAKEVESMKTLDRAVQNRRLEEVSLNDRLEDLNNYSKYYSGVSGAFEPQNRYNETELKKYLVNAMNDKLEIQQLGKKASSAGKMKLYQKALEQQDTWINRIGGYLDTIAQHKKADELRDATKGKQALVADRKLDLRAEFNSKPAGEWQTKREQMVSRYKDLTAGKKPKATNRDEAYKLRADINAMDEDALENHPTWIAEPRIDANTGELIPGSLGQFRREQGELDSRLQKFNQKQGSGPSTPTEMLNGFAKQLFGFAEEAHTVATAKASPDLYNHLGAITPAAKANVDSWVSDEVAKEVALRKQETGKDVGEQEARQVKAYYEQYALAHPNVIPKLAAQPLVGGISKSSTQAKPAAKKDKYGLKLAPPPDAPSIFGKGTTMDTIAKMQFDSIIKFTSPEVLKSLFEQAGYTKKEPYRGPPLKEK
jgi:hypothetical protein